MRMEFEQFSSQKLKKSLADTELIDNVKIPNGIITSPLPTFFTFGKSFLETKVLR